MQPQNKCNDCEPESIFREIKAGEKRIDEGAMVPEKSLASVRNKTLPPLKKPLKIFKSDATSVPRDKTSQSLWGGAFSLGNEGPITSKRTLFRNYSDDSACHKVGYDGGFDELRKNNIDRMRNYYSFDEHRKNFDTPNSQLSEFSRNNRTKADASNGNHMNSSHPKLPKSSVFGVDQRHQNFDAYLKHVLDKREEDKLFDRSASRGGEVRRERPKSARYGRRRPQTGLDGHYG